MGIVKLSVRIFNRHCSSFYRRNLIHSGRTACAGDLNLKTSFCIFLNLSLALPWLASQYLSFSVPRVLRSPFFSYTLFSFIYLLRSFCLVSPFVKLSLCVTWFHVIVFCSSLCSPFLPLHPHFARLTAKLLWSRSHSVHKRHTVIPCHLNFAANILYWN